uniref:Uncharacterized protein n=1 Tax=Arundo donax TaxID=35708 RepID=A0A0A9H471_ARUDO
MLFQRFPRHWVEIAHLKTKKMVTCVISSSGEQFIK